MIATPRTKRDWRAGAEAALRDSRARRDVPLRELTTLRVGGPADLLVDLESEHDLTALMAWCESERILAVVIGKGSNLLASDAGLRGVVLRMGRGLAGFGVAERPEWVRAGAGLPNATLVSRARELGLGGMEFLVAIPGTVGGAVAMNAGAHGRETAHYLERVRLFERGQGITEIAAREFAFSYRDSPLRAHLGRLVLAAVFRLAPMAPEAIRASEAEIQEYRRRTQPRDYPNCGSVFVNPPGDFAGRLIEQCGLKGRSIGSAQVSEKHANFIVNKGSATAADVLELIDLVRESVYQETGVRLELELQVMDEQGKFQSRA